MQFPEAYLPWVDQQLLAGRTFDQLRDHLTGTAGYTPHMAEQLLAAAREGSARVRLPAPGQRPDVRRDAKGVPLADAQDLPGGRRRVLVEMLAPQVLVFQHFVPDGLVQAVLAELEGQATRVDRYLDRDRAAQDWLLPDRGAAAACLDAAAANLNWPRARWGLPLVRDTATGQSFNLHYDAFGTGAVDDAAFKAVHGDVGRIGTLLLYLQPAEQGGATCFANLGLRLNLGPGDAVYFGYPRDQLARSGVLHGGEPVERGLKRIMTLWCYERELRRGPAAD